MAKNPKQPAAEPSNPANPSVDAASKPTTPGPVFEAVGWAPTKDGHVVMYITVQDGVVLMAEIIDGPMSKLAAQDALKIAVVKRLMWPGGLPPP